MISRPSHLVCDARHGRRARGFSLIELMIVIAMLGVLLAVAAPRFFSVASEAEGATLSGLASALAGTMAVNYAGCSATGHSTSGANAKKCTQVRYCDDIAAALMEPLDATRYQITHTELGATNGKSGTCGLAHLKSGASVEFMGIAAGNP